MTFPNIKNLNLVNNRKWRYKMQIIWILRKPEVRSLNANNFNLVETGSNIIKCRQFEFRSNRQCRHKMQKILISSKPEVTPQTAVNSIIVKTGSDVRKSSDSHIIKPEVMSQNPENRHKVWYSKLKDYFFFSFSSVLTWALDRSWVYPKLLYKGFPILDRLCEWCHWLLLYLLWQLLHSHRLPPLLQFFSRRIHPQR